MTPKEQVIKNAYGAHWEDVKMYVDENGFTLKKSLIDYDSNLWDSKSVKNANNTYAYRPKSLSGIDNNNCWIKVESKDDLPNEFTPVHFILHNEIIMGNYNSDFKVFHKSHFEFYKWNAITHYQPIVKPQKPIY